jgi:lysophospholipase L1-like esterase
MKVRRLFASVSLVACVGLVAGFVTGGGSDVVALAAGMQTCKPAKQFGVVFVLDDSGSNLQTDPRLLRADAVRVAMGYLPEGTLVSGVRFSNAAATDVEVTRLTNENRGSLVAYIRDNLESNGATNYEAGFRQAIVQLQKMASAQRIVIFLSDGMPTQPYSADQLIAQQVIPIHTVGYGPVRNLPVLIDIARRSRGTYQPIDNVAEASNAFAKIVNPYQCNRPIEDETTTLRPNKRYEASFRATPGTVGLSAIATWTSQATPRLTLVRPDGTELRRGGVIRHGEGIAQEGLQVLRFDVTRPLVGVWKLVAVSPKKVNLAFNVWRTQKGPIDLPPFKYIALGDSFSAGEGLDYYLRSHVDGRSGKQVFEDNRCHRASRAYPAFVQPRVYDKPLYAIASGGGDPGRLRGSNKYGSDANVRSAGGVTWMFLACSGARTYNVMPSKAGGRPQSGHKQHFDPMPQLDHPSLGGAELVTITIGGNDAGFVEVLTKCGLGARCATDEYKRERLRVIERLHGPLVDVYRAVRNATGGGARILAVGYPQIFAHPDRRDAGCMEVFDGVEKNMIRELGSALNDVTRRAAKDAGTRVEFVPADDRFAGHELCGKKGTLIHPIDLSVLGKLSRDEPINHESFHPTRDGQRKYAEIINDVLQDGKP